jgi:hypothetical protein
MSKRGIPIPTERPSAPSRSCFDGRLTNAQREFARMLGHLLARLWDEEGRHVVPKERDEPEGEQAPTNPAGD